ncbi:hypothetical protein [Dyadobacter fermentans]|uniref:Uncharacterized protein n=1 Tax=Dyadobacter fermentans (strain ATCC 700827 / DSM 18053 / CIP 107007 / KCTC 52180 / NS114) TaxID=471854 RepID=C6VVI1_DYAFD|nr:hypothetical protein [Dyadobacter fermentans]ACT96711.1 hypothetical protein Dfer_5520 [Dyadobacter fermentans DSM 18053]
MDFLSAAYFDSTITVDAKVRASSTYALPAVNTSNVAYSSGGFESYVANDQYTAGARPGYGFHAAGNFGVFLYAQSGSELRIRSNTGIDNTLWHSGNARSDSQNDTRYSQIGHTHVIADVTGLQTALDGKVSRSPSQFDWHGFSSIGLATFNTASTNGPAGAGVYHGLFIPHATGSSYGTNIAFRNGNFYIKSLENGAWGSWIKIASETYVNSQGFVTSAGLTGYVQNTRQINTGAGLLGGGPLSADLSLTFDTTFGDARYSLSSHTHTAAQITDFSTAGRALFSVSNGISYTSGTGAFALTYGTAANTVAQGNDSRIINGQAAHMRWVSTPGEFSDINNINKGGVATYGTPAAGRPTTYGTTFTFVGNSSTGDSAGGAYLNQILVGTTADWYVRHGLGATWGATYQIWTAKQFNIANYATTASLSDYVMNNTTGLSWTTAHSDGKHKFHGSSTNSPTGFYHVGFTATSPDAQTAASLAFRNGNGYFRTVEAGVVGSWQQFLTSANLSGYVPTSRTITINGVTKNLSANQDWGTIGGSGIPGSVSDRTIPRYELSSGSFVNSSIDETVSTVDIRKSTTINKTGSSYYIQMGGLSNTLGISLYNSTGSNSFTFSRYNDEFSFSSATGVTIFEVKSDSLVNFVMPNGVAPFKVNSSTLVTSLNADLLDGQHASAFASASHTHTASQVTDFTSAARAAISATGSISYNSATGVISGGGSDTRWISTPVNYSDINTITSSGVFSWGNSAANRPSAFGTMLSFIGASPDGNLGSNMWMSQLMCGTDANWFVRYGQAGTIYQVWTSKQFNIANYATTSYVDSNTYTRGYIDSELSIRALSGISLTGQLSITGGGTLTASRTYQLVNDSGSPGANKLYGTNGSGVKGWYDQPSGGGGAYSAGSGIGLSGSTFFVNGGTGLNQDGDGLSLDVGWTDGRYLRGSGTPFRVAYWGAGNTLTSSSIMTDGGNQIQISGHLGISNGMLILPPFASEPVAPVAGSMYFSTGNYRPRYYNGTVWVNI